METNSMLSDLERVPLPDVGQPSTMTAPMRCGQPEKVAGDGASRRGQMIEQVGR
jgi:hypothetical protein